ncbi:MAG: formimidoylglutamate deiminase [Acidobacteriota bacterium]|nr:formimidoylglutamate deiminase [Acidobacteriota bacterium]
MVLPTNAQTAWLPDLLLVGGRFRRGLALVTDDETGRIVSIPRADDHDAARVVRLEGRALLPGMVNAHSHAFQRVIRGRTEFRTAARDTFWTWREQMYSAARQFTPEQLYDASRMAFLEMALGGVTTVGEFHYLHHNPDGTPYDDPNLLARQVIRAARDVGLRVALLRTAYARSGFNSPPNERQRRFITRDPQDFIKHTDALRADLARDERAAERGDGRADERLPTAWAGVAPHSVRAVPLDYWREVSAYARAHSLVVHAHVAEQPAEIEACRAEYGRPPVTLLEENGLIDERFTAVHAIHVAPEEAQMLASERAHVCACPTTERNLGDGVFPADLFSAENVRVALGTDSHVQIDLLEDARELELNLRLAKLSRAVIAPPGESAKGEGAGGEGQSPFQTSTLAARLFECATLNGASSVGADAGAFEPGRAADFFAVTLDDPSIAGASEDDLLAAVVFALARGAVRDVAVGGRLVVEDGRHAGQDEIVARFAALQRDLWG